MTREELEKMLDAIQGTAGDIANHEKDIVRMESEIRRIQRAIELDKKELATYREFVLTSMFGEEKTEEPDQNADPEEVPPVTDMEEVQKVVKSGGKSKRIFMRNTETGVEKEFPSKTRAAQFLDITQQYLAKILKDGGTFKGWWVTEVADTPTA
jgi:chromosome segregation ATPase